MKILNKSPFLRILGSFHVWHTGLKNSRFWTGSVNIAHFTSVKKTKNETSSLARRWEQQCPPPPLPPFRGFPTVGKKQEFPSHRQLASKSGNHAEAPETSHCGTKLWKTAAFCLSFSTINIKLATMLTNNAIFIHFEVAS